MFSGIVATIGYINQLEIINGCKYFTITPKDDMADLVIGESIAINGVCLTVTSFTETTFNVTVVPETIRLTNLAELTVGSVVNLERSLRMGDRIGGHHVQGHVDCVGEIIALTHDNSDAWLVKISIPKRLGKYIVNKGYIALDGMSITVIESAPEWFTVTFIPHTQDVTITKHYSIGSSINIEVDIMGKYIEKLAEVYIHA